MKILTTIATIGVILLMLLAARQYYVTQTHSTVLDRALTTMDDMATVQTTHANVLIRNINVNEQLADMLSTTMERQKQILINQREISGILLWAVEESKINKNTRMLIKEQLTDVVDATDKLIHNK